MARELISISLFLLLFALVLSILVIGGQVKGALKSQPYYCTDLEVDNLKSFSARRFFRNEDKLYFVFDDQVLFTRLIFEAKDASKQSPSTIVHHFYKYAAVEKALTEFGFFNLFQVLGHFYENSTGKTTEFYSLVFGLSQEKTIVTRTSFVLDFSQSMGGRKVVADLSEIKLGKYSPTLFNIFAENVLSSYVDIDYDRKNKYIVIARFKTKPSNELQFFFARDEDELPNQFNYDRDRKSVV